MMVIGDSMVGPGDPRYVSVEQATREDLARRAEYEKRPEVIERREQERRITADKAAAKAAKRLKDPPNTDYPWLKPDWVEPPVRPVKR